MNYLIFKKSLSSLFMKRPLVFACFFISISGLPAFVSSNDTQGAPYCFNKNEQPKICWGCDGKVVDQMDPAGVKCVVDESDGGSDEGSIIMNARMLYFTWVVDYQTPVVDPSCSSCSAGSDAGSGVLPSLMLVRYSAFRAHDAPLLSFGRGTGLKGYDRNLSFLTNNDIVYSDFGNINSDHCH